MASRGHRRGKQGHSKRRHKTRTRQATPAKVRLSLGTLRSEQEARRCGTPCTVREADCRTRIPSGRDDPQHGIRDTTDILDRRLEENPPHRQVASEEHVVPCCNDLDAPYCWSNGRDDPGYDLVARYCRDGLEVRVVPKGLAMLWSSTTMIRMGVHAIRLASQP